MAVKGCAHKYTSTTTTSKPMTLPTKKPVEKPQINQLVKTSYYTACNNGDP
jgi:hypothetical protein